MWTPRPNESISRPELYSSLQAQLHALINDEPDAVANMANCVALLFHALQDVNWVGFYLLQGDQLVLGPFQGQPACVRIPLGRGVCGAAAKEQRTFRVANVNEFPGHIACDSASKSELVIPLIASNGELLGVLDLDSPLLNRFDEEDQAALESVAAIVSRKIFYATETDRPR